jgi:hypothetical protein
MTRNTNHTGNLMTEADRQHANKFILSFLQGTMNDGKDEILNLRMKLSITYWVIIGLSIAMFILGIALLSVPLMAAWRAEIDILRSLIAAGFGIADLTTLFLFRPVERIYQLMGDFSQMTLTLNSYQTQVALRLKEMNGNNRPSIGRAAEHIGAAAQNSSYLVQTYFEEREAV